jgi:hypothetical protein
MAGGLLTIPRLSLVAFLAITVLTVVVAAIERGSPADPDAGERLW